MGQAGGRDGNKRIKMWFCHGDFIQLLTKRSSKNGMLLTECILKVVPLKYYQTFGNNEYYSSDIISKLNAHSKISSFLI